MRCSANLSSKDWPRAVTNVDGPATAGALELAGGQQFDAIILDLMLPEMNGLEVLTRIRGQGVHTPVLVLTALGSVEDRVTGLESGADDYLVKPFALPELLARLHAHAAAGHSRPSPALRVGR